MAYIKDLGKEESFDHVLLRIEGKVTDFYLDDVGETVVKIINCKTLHDVEVVFRNYKAQYPRKVVLLLGLDITEIDPHMSGPICIPLATSDAINVLKIMSEAGVRFWLPI